ncbi:hypothetical protein TNCV_679671 [Trichonephila clavipes]|nr:hypothetical protein TNCV_679671 [Trichonephila clavipes]
MWYEREKKKREIGMARKRAEKGSLGFPGFVKPVFTKDSKPREKEKITRAPRERETRTHLKKGGLVTAATLHLTKHFFAAVRIIQESLFITSSKRSSRKSVTERDSCLLVFFKYYTFVTNETYTEP